MVQTKTKKDRLFVDSFVLLLFSLFILIFWRNDIHTSTKFLCYATTAAGVIGVFIFSKKDKIIKN